MILTKNEFSIGLGATLALESLIISDGMLAWYVQPRSLGRLRGIDRGLRCDVTVVAGKNKIDPAAGILSIDDGHHTTTRHLAGSCADDDFGFRLDTDGLGTLVSSTARAAPRRGPSTKPTAGSSGRGRLPERLEGGQLRHPKFKRVSDDLQGY